MTRICLHLAGCLAASVPKTGEKLYTRRRPNEILLSSSLSFFPLLFSSTIFSFILLPSLFILLLFIIDMYSVSSQEHPCGSSRVERRRREERVGCLEDVKENVRSVGKAGKSRKDHNTCNPAESYNRREGKDERRNRRDEAVACCEESNAT